MEKLKSLFIIFLLFIFISLVFGAGVACISKEAGFIATGVALILSSIVVVTLFILEFTLARKSEPEQ